MPKPIKHKQWLSCTKDYKKIRAYFDELTGKLSAEQKTDSENLIAMVASLREALNEAAARLAIKCPPNVKGGECPQPDDIDCRQCWLEFLMKEEK